MAQPTTSDKLIGKTVFLPHTGETGTITARKKHKYEITLPPSKVCNFQIYLQVWSFELVIDTNNKLSYVPRNIEKS